MPYDIHYLDEDDMTMLVKANKLPFKSMIRVNSKTCRHNLPD